VSPWTGAAGPVEVYAAEEADDRAKASVANRIPRVLEEAHIKLASVATDVLGVSGRDMLREIVEGRDDPEFLAELARGKLRAKIRQLRPALHSRGPAHGRLKNRDCSGRPFRASTVTPSNGITSNARHARTRGPGPRRWPGSSATLQPASSSASAMYGLDRLVRRRRQKGSRVDGLVVIVRIAVRRA
jgi:hypothetical protein